jgi:hypothetical protein
MLKYIIYMEIIISNALAFRKIKVTNVTRVSMNMIHTVLRIYVRYYGKSKRNQKYDHVTISSWDADILKCDLPVFVDF